MKITDQTRLTVRGVKHAKFASQETECFSLTLCLDDKPVAVVENDGQGGGHRVHPAKGVDYPTHRAKLAEIDTFLATLDGWRFPKDFKGVDPDEEHPYDFDMAVSALLNDHLLAKDFDRQAKRTMLYCRSDKAGLYVAKVPAADHQRAIAHWQGQNPGVTYTVLNSMPRAEALALYRERVGG